MNQTEEEEFDWAKGEMASLREKQRCCALGTVSKNGAPLSSYAPVFIDERFRLYVFVSAMAKHYGHLRGEGLASVTLIEDESAAENLFARKRLTVDCVATLVPRDSEEWKQGTAGIEKRCGETMSYLVGLSDFDLFRLDPSEGRLVLGFGKAYRVWGEGLGEIGYLGAGGHRTKG